VQFAVYVTEMPDVAVVAPEMEVHTAPCFGAAQAAVDPPLQPLQAHVHEVVASVTEEGMPAVHKPLVGFAALGEPFAAPQVPAVSGSF
jgi:hypothetical protein